MSDIINPRINAKPNRSGFYEITWSEREGGRTKSFYRSTGSKDRAEAEAILKDWLNKREHLREREASPLINDLLDRYLTLAQAKGKGATQEICVNHLKKHFIGARVCDIDSTLILKYERDRGVSGPTIRRELGALVAAINLGVKDRKISLAEKPIIDLPKPGEARTEYLRPDEIDSFLSLARAHTKDGEPLSRLTLFVFIALETGARSEAIRDLQWSAINFKENTIDFRNGVAHNKRRVKTAISPILRPVLEQAFKEKTSPYVLGHAGSIRKAWESWIAKTPYADRITPHCLRKSFASAALQAGVPVEVVSDAIGDSVATTLKFYAFISEKQRGDAVNWRNKLKVAE